MSFVCCMIRSPSLSVVFGIVLTLWAFFCYPGSYLLLLLSSPNQARRYGPHFYNCANNIARNAQTDSTPPHLSAKAAKNRRAGLVCPTRPTTIRGASHPRSASLRPSSAPHLRSASQPSASQCACRLRTPICSPRTAPPARGAFALLHAPRHIDCANNA